MIMSLKQRKMKFEPRIKLNHNIYNKLFWVGSAEKELHLETSLLRK